MKKRIVLLLSVVALMVVMLATSVAPGFAAPTTIWACFNPTTGDGQLALSKDQKKELEGLGYECTKPEKIKKPPKPPKPL